MKLKTIAIALLWAAISTSSVRAAELPDLSNVGPHCMPREISPIQAPFKMEAIPFPDIPKREVTVKMNRKGLSTENIQKAIDKLAKKGGGTVIIPQGQWQTGRIVLRSHINLHISEGAELIFSGRIKDYQPAVFTRDEGMEVYTTAACIYACDATDIAVTGKGTITSATTDSEIYRQNTETSLDTEHLVNGTPLEQRIFNGMTGGVVYLPKTIAPIRCKRILIEGLTLNQCFYWNVVMQYCDQAILRGITVTSYGHGRTDGIDIDSSTNVLIEYCSLDCGDDCYTIKSGRGKDGIRVNKPTENVVIRHCLAKRGGGGIVCGTETAGGINNVYMHDCVFDGTSQAFRFKTRRTRGGNVSNIFVERIKASVKDYGIFVDMLGSTRWVGNLAYRYPVQDITPLTPSYRNIDIKDVEITHCQQLVKIDALPERPIRNISFSRVKASCDKIGYAKDAKGLLLKDIIVSSPDSTFLTDGCEDVQLVNVRNVTLNKNVQ